MKPLFILVVICIVCISGCGPSPEEQAVLTAGVLTSTAGAWTPTPTSTHIPTRSPTLTSTPTLTPTLTPTSTLTPTLTATRDSARFYSPDGTFSIIPPLHWISEDVGMVYPGLFGPILAGYRLRLGFILEESSEMLEWYTAFAQDALKERMPINQISEDMLETANGKTYFRWEFTTNRDGVSYLNIVNFFESGDWKLTILYSRPEAVGMEYDAQVDEAMKTVIFTAPK